ncbi:MAG TPA: glycosyltransferase family 4 protein [Thermoplasmata archaeon]|nr:glycosyltransferase family 4 protein [Thermoplasmata archaeon]
MRIALVTLRYDAPGGVETVVRQIAGRLRTGGDEVAVYASDLYDEGEWVRRTDFPPIVDGVPVHRFPVRRHLIPRLSMPMMVGLIDALAASDADVLHAHSHRYGHVLQSAAVAERRGIPLVVSTHYHPAHRSESGLKRGLLRLQDAGFGASAYRVARAIIVITEHEARLVREFAPRGRIHVIPHGIDLAAWGAPERDGPPPAGLPPQYFLFAGRLAPNKGLPELFEALARLDPPHRLPLVLLGPEWGQRSALVAHASRLGLEREVVFLGHVDDPAAYRAVIRGAKALVLPSEYEAFGLVLLDAMAARVPIVATAVGGVPEVLDGGRVGRLVPYGDPAALAQALRDVRDDADGTRARTLAASEWVTRYDWSVAIERLRSVYRAVAA